MNLNYNSPVQTIRVNEQLFYIKRDDLISNEFSGNKARKLYYYITAKLPGIDTLISYGGIQSNMMYALSYLAKLRQWKFIYYTKYIPEQVTKLVTGNYFAALQNKMQVCELRQQYDAIINRLLPSTNQLLIPQGGFHHKSKYGMQLLAQELINWAEENQIQEFNVFLPSGTGASALYLQQALKPFKVYTTNCVGSPSYLCQQFQRLSNVIEDQPTILENLNFQFAKPDIELLKVFNSLKKQTDIEFDLIYDTVGWHIVLENLSSLANKPLIYIHCGGTLGNTTQVLRYNYSKLY